MPKKRDENGTSPKMEEASTKTKTVVAASSSKKATGVSKVKSVKVSNAEQQTPTHSFNAVEPFSKFTDFDIALFRSGKHYKLYEK